MASSTKRILFPITWPAGKVGRGHLLPDLRARQRTAFACVPGGRPASHGMVGFVGTAVTAVDMLVRWEASVGQVEDRERTLDELEGYVRWVAQQRLGTVFEASYDSGGLLVARKVGDQPPVRRVPIPE
jgi:hypothetical protein